MRPVSPLVTLSEVLVRYRDLSARIEEKFAEIQARYPSDFACAAGCHSCCKPELTVGMLEAENIREFLTARPEVAAAMLKNEKANPFRGKRCSFLTQAGRCGIYEARPFVCRSHGAPLQYKEGSGEDALRLRDVCPLNFTDKNIGELPADAVLNLDTLNTLLAVLSKQAFGKNSKRAALKPSTLCEPSA
jgi:Fe-S-cluster containining protein